ncbi:MAG: hypothetical protein R3230_01250 [Nitrosopumilaceae archaeon]|nr:hypothetical protein [Nitrosopumilaceae archaeon]
MIHQSFFEALNNLTDYEEDLVFLFLRAMNDNDLISLYRQLDDFVSKNVTENSPMDICKFLLFDIRGELRLRGNKEL